MAKQQTCQKFVFKIHTKRLVEAKWDLTLPLDEARRNHEIISLADSTVLRWIDELNGVTDAEAKARSIKRRIKMLRNEPSCLENRREIRRLYTELDTVQFKPDYMCLVVDKKNDYRRACSSKGFKINGITYRRLVGTTGGVKNSTIVFVSDRLVDEIRKRIDNGRNRGMEFVPAKLEAYRALACSASIPVTDPDGVLVVDDCYTHFKDHVVVLDDGVSGEPTIVEDKEHDCELCANDGFGLISYDLAQQWSEDLKLPSTASGFCVRNAFCKGMLFPFPFREFAKKVAKQNMLKDAWGDYRDINRIQVVLSTSMLKLWDSYHSCEDYLENCRENHYHFSVTKTCELELDEERNLNYQFIQSYQLTNDEIRELVKPTLDEINGVMGGDWRDALLYLRGSGMRDDPNYINSLENDYIKALMIEPEMINDPYVQNRIRYFIKKRISQAKTGVVKVRGNFQVASGDPYALCQSMFRMEVTGLLKAGEVYSRFWNDRDVKRIACFRAPMSQMANIRCMNLNVSDDCKYWYRYMKSVFITNAWDNMCAALNGEDFDADLTFSTDNRVLIDKWVNEPVVLCVQRKCEKKVPTEKDFIESNISGFGDNIGRTTNRITTMFDVRSKFEQGSKEYDELTYRIICGQLYQQNAIDKIKGVATTDMPQYWYDNKACAVKDDDNPDTIEDKKFWSSICAWRKPYFMSYIYPAQMRDYKQYVAAARKRIKWDGFAGLDEIMQKTVKDDVDEMVIQYYLYRMPVGINSCTMNRLCWTVEDELEDFEEELKIKRKFDYDSSYIVRAVKDGIVREVRKIYTSGDKPTKGDVGLGNVDNTADANKSVASAAKLTTARTVSGGSDITLSFNYDGSGNSTANIGFYSCKHNVDNTNNYPFHRFARLDVNKGAWVDKSITFLISQDYSGGGYGICRLVYRSNADSGSASVDAQWLVRRGFSADTIQVAIKTDKTNGAYCDAFYKSSGTYMDVVIRAIASGGRATSGRTWTLVDSNEVGGTTATDKKTSSECWKTIADAGTALHKQAYSASAPAKDEGYVASAGSANTSSSCTGNSASATKLTSSAGSAAQPVYFKDGKPVAGTYTLGDASSKTVRTLGAVGNTGWANKTTDDKYIPTMSFMAYWNGAYSGTSSNLQYCDRGRFGTIVTKGSGDYAVAGHTHNYAGSGSAGGSANSAVKLDSNAGSSVQPVYFSGGKPVAIGYTISSSVPANAKFTDTTYGVASSSSNGLMSSTDKTKLDDFSRVINIQKQIKLTTDWLDTGIAGNSLDTGTYVVQVSGFNSSHTQLYSEIYSGVMSWYSGTTNSGNSSEIFLHNAGLADNNNAIYLRTLRVAGSKTLKLQIACKVAATGTDTLTFKFRRLI